MSLQIRVEADLGIDVDGTPAHLAGNGSTLILSSPHPERVWRAVVSAALPAAVGDLNGPRALGRVGDGLAEAGLRLQVSGPHGTVADLGHGVHSRLGHLVTGSTAVAPGSARALTALWLNWIKARTRPGLRRR